MSNFARSPWRDQKIFKIFGLCKAQADAEKAAAEAAAAKVEAAQRAEAARLRHQDLASYPKSPEKMQSHCLRIMGVTGS